jgi:hypothetical protein
MYRMAPRETRERFYPRPSAVEPSETLFSLKGAKELPISSLHAMKKWKWVLRRRPARLSSPGVNAGAFRRDLKSKFIFPSSAQNQYHFSFICSRYIIHSPFCP